MRVSDKHNRELFIDHSIYYKYHKVKKFKKYHDLNKNYLN
jgi:hypothetical protein